MTAAIDARNPVERFFQLAMLGMLGAGYGAVLITGALDLATAVPAGVAIFARLLMTLNIVRARVSEGLATALALGYIGFFPVDYLYLSGEFLPATVHLVFFIASVLVLKARSMRDFRLLQLIAFLQMLAATVLSVNAAYFAFLAIFVLSGAGALASGEIRARLAGEPRVVRTTLTGSRRALAFVTAGAFLGILAAGAGFFLLLPRTARVAMQHLVPNRFHLPGFSNEVLLGQIGEIRMTSTPVMHARVYNSIPGLDLKWRGSTLGSFDGKRWYNETDRGEPVLVDRKHARLAPVEQLAMPGKRLQYEVQLKSATDDVLFFAGLPEQISIDAPQIIRTNAGGYRTGGLAASMRYAAWGFIDTPGRPPYTRELGPGSRAIYLRTPEMDSRVAELAARLTSGVDGAERKAHVIEKHLLTQYGYTTELPKEIARDPVAQFLFDRRKGHCEYFASAMAVMLRTQGIPSRVATGFQSGTYNPVSDWYLVRASDAHSWVEAWIDGRGWTTFDPTPPDLRPQETGLMASAGFYLDAMEVFWQDWVMSYDLERQLLLAERVGRGGWTSNFSWPSVWAWMKSAWNDYVAKWGLWVAGAVVAGEVLFWVMLPFVPRLWRRWKHRREEARIRRGEAQASDAAFLYARMLDALKRHGVEKPGWLTPREFARTLGASPARVHVEKATEAYHEWRHGGRAEAAARMLDALGGLEASMRRS